MSSDVPGPEAAAPSRTAGGSIRSIVDDLRESASVESVYGDPVEAGDVTVVPVARVAYGFGGGFGRGGVDTGTGDADESGGVGGGVAASPVGVVEIADGQTRVLGVGGRRRQVAALAIGLLVGLLLGRRRGRDRK